MRERERERCQCQNSRCKLIINHVFLGLIALVSNCCAKYLLSHGDNWPKKLRKKKSFYIRVVDP